LPDQRERPAQDVAEPERPKRDAARRRGPSGPGTTGLAADVLPVARRLRGWGLRVALLAILLLPVPGLTVAARAWLGISIGRGVGIGCGVGGRGTELGGATLSGALTSPGWIGARLTGSGRTVPFALLRGLSGARPDALTAVRRIVLLRLTGLMCLTSLL
jgi:hypothetical protein